MKRRSDSFSEPEVVNDFALKPDKFSTTTHLELSSGGATISSQDNNLQGKKFWGRSLLVFVAFLYGTLYVCLRRVYALSSPPTAAALSATRGWLAAICFLHLPFQAKSRIKKASTTTAVPRRLLWLTALDLAFWNFLAQGLTNLGLLYCSSARASFLIQSSVIFTPLLSLGLGQKVSRSLWGGVCLAFAGLSVLSSSGVAAAASDTPTMVASTLFGALRNWFSSIRPGDGLVLGGALCWSFYLLRLSRASSAANNRHQIDFPALDLQAIKTFLLAIMYTGWWCVSSCLRTNTASSGSTPWWTSGAAWFWLAISAIGPGAVADVLQQKGQQQVSATEANVIMSSEPVFTALSGFLLLGEKLATREVTGGAMILLAALVSSVAS